MAAKGKTGTGKAAQAAWRADLTARGYKQKAVWISPAGLRALERITARDECGEAEAIDLALQAAASEGLPHYTNEQLLKLIGRRLKPG